MPKQWFVPLPSGFPRAVHVDALRSEFGTLGVAVPVVLLAEAEAQKQLRGERGAVRLGYAELAYLVATDPATARSVVERWVEFGEMVDAEFGPFGFSARWKDWDLWQEPRQGAELDKAETWLKHALAAGERRTADVMREADAAGVAERTVERARKTLNVQWRREGDGVVMWLPSNSANSAVTATEVEVEGEVELPTTPRTGVPGSAGRGDEIGRLCHMHADLVLARRPGRKVAPDGQAWRTACSALLDEGYSTADLAVSIAECDGRIPSMPRLATAIRSGESLSKGNE